MKANKSTGTSGVGITGLLQVAFIVLKLCGVIKWSWWWVLSPLWISLGLWLTVAIVIYGSIAIVAWINKRKRGKK